MALATGQLFGSTAGPVQGSTAAFNLGVGATIILKALSANSTAVFIGNSTSLSSTNGFALNPGQQIQLRIPNLSLVYLSAAAADGICWIQI